LNVNRVPFSLSPPHFLSRSSFPFFFLPSSSTKDYYVRAFGHCPGIQSGDARDVPASPPVSFDSSFPFLMRDGEMEASSALDAVEFGRRILFFSSLLSHLLLPKRSPPPLPISFGIRPRSFTFTSLANTMAKPPPFPFSPQLVLPFPPPFLPEAQEEKI